MGARASHLASNLPTAPHLSMDPLLNQLKHAACTSGVPTARPEACWTRQVLRARFAYYINKFVPHFKVPDPGSVRRKLLSCRFLQGSRKDKTATRRRAQHNQTRGWVESACVTTFDEKTLHAKQSEQALMAAPIGTRSTFGSQQQSKRQSAPQWGFGSSTREHQEKVFLSQDHSALNTGARSPGPVSLQPA